MAEMSKSPEQASQEAPSEQTATGWESLENYDYGNTEDGSDCTHHSPFEKVPAINGNDLLDSGVFFGDAIELTQKYIPTSPETPEENQALLNFGGVYVLVDKDSDPEGLKEAWARAMRGHCDQQITVTDDHTDIVIGNYPLVTDTLDNIPEEILEAEAAEDEAKRRARDEKIQRADAIINREEIYRRLKDEVWDVELVFNTENTLPPNVFGDRKNPRLASPFKTVSEAKKVMYASYAIIWAKLIQQRLDSEEAATIESVAEETLNKLGIDVDIFDPLFGTITSYLSPGSNWKWNHSKDLFKWYKEVCERQSRHSSPLPPEAQ